MFSVIEERRKKALSIGKKSIYSVIHFVFNERSSPKTSFLSSAVLHLSAVLGEHSYIHTICSFLLSLNMLISKHSPYSEATHLSHL